MVVLFDLTGRKALVTGASRGIGAAAANALAEAGADIALLARDTVGLNHTADRVREHGRTAHVIECDLSVAENIDAAVASAQSACGHIDILINNAGIIRRSPAVDYSLDDWRDVLDVNLTSMFRMSQVVGRAMIERGSGKIINIASLLSFLGGVNVIGYTASKSAIAGMTRGLANEWAKHGVNVNAIAPGYFHTDATSSLQQNPERYEALRARIPAGRWGEPAELGGTIVYLASSASDYVHGHVLAVDGGFLAA
ncbi:MAG: SDR family oxidoreductase [bacterium]|nr:SDR family oxidoreductase [Candidatus Kapabacteria bacterium]